jgi:hypothetical protein
MNFKKSKSWRKILNTQLQKNNGIAYKSFQAFFYKSISRNK